MTPTSHHPAAAHTMVLQVGAGWAVCTKTTVPVILARFEHRSEAAAWQSAHEARMSPAKAA